MEEALYEIASLRNFAGLALSEPIPDETTILNFRHMLEESDLADDIFKQVNALLARNGLLLKRGSIVDATIIAAPSSTKNEHAKASVRAKVEHPFHVIKRQFGLAKVRFKGLQKNTAHLLTLFALSNLWMARRHLIGQVRPNAA